MSTFVDLRRALIAALETEKIGTPVALRLYVRQAGAATDPAAVLAIAASLAASVFSSPPAKLTARCTQDRRQANALLTYAVGQTLLLSVVGVSNGEGVDLLLIGNHGIVRLEGGELLESSDCQTPGDTQRWQQLTAQSLATAAAVDVDVT